jgi:hypothetical protein
MVQAADFTIVDTDCSPDYVNRLLERLEPALTDEDSTLIVYACVTENPSCSAKWLAYGEDLDPDERPPHAVWVDNDVLEMLAKGIDLPSASVSECGDIFLKHFEKYVESHSPLFKFFNLTE